MDKQLQIYVVLNRVERIMSRSFACKKHSHVHWVTEWKKNKSAEKESNSTLKKNRYRMQQGNQCVYPELQKKKRKAKRTARIVLMQRKVSA